MSDIGKYLSVNIAGLVERVFDNPGTSILRLPFQALLSILGQVAARAIELDDPQLNILMLRLNLYDVPPEQRGTRIDEQYARIKE